MTDVLVDDQQDARETDEETDDGDAVAIEIVTDLIPAKPIKIDGIDYKLLSFDHLSPQQEAQVNGIFARFQQAYQALMVSKTDAQAVERAKKLRKLRERLICKMTTVPLDVVEGLSGRHQGKLLDVIADEMGEDVGAEAGDDGDAFA